MIFDSIEMEKLRERFKSELDFRVPRIVFLDRSNELCEERGYLEGLLLAIPSRKRKGLLNRIQSEQDSQFLGAWFELMLYGWLLESFDTQYEPTIEGDEPDFLIKTQEQNIIIEAKVLQESETNKQEYLVDSELIRALKQIKKPFGIFIKAHNLKEVPKLNRFVRDVDHWLDQNNKDDKETYSYVFKNNSTIVMEAIFSDGLDHVEVFSPSRPWKFDTNAMKSALSKKGKQHKNLRKAGYPYVIAIMIESSFVDADDVISAWLGNIQVVIETNSMQIIGQKFDKSGLHFFGEEIFHKSVSGTLFIKPNHFSQRRYLQSWYIENPFAVVKIPSNIFPSLRNWSVKSEDDTGISMGWEEKR